MAKLANLKSYFSKSYFSKSDGSKTRVSDDCTFKNYTFKNNNNANDNLSHYSIDDTINGVTNTLTHNHFCDDYDDINNGNIITSNTNNTIKDLANGEVAQLIQDNLMDEMCSCERHWIKAREHLIELQERRLFWFGENSLRTWIVAQLIGYVSIAMLVMLAINVLNWQVSLNVYFLIFIIHTLIFVLMYLMKGWFGRHLQGQINKYNSLQEQALNRLNELAQHTILPDIHANLPLSLQAIRQRYQDRLQLTSLQFILHQEIKKGNMLLNNQSLEVHLPPEFAEDKLSTQAERMIYKSIKKH